jgi:GntR family transcriptional regulator, arabinose operon transcriptional repressor
MRINLQAIDRSSPEPLHQQLANLLRGAISAGVYKPGDRMESEKQFIDAGGLSYTPVARAFQTLAAEGWVVRRPGSGTYVSGGSDHSPNPVLASIGFFYYRFDTPYFEALFSGVKEECALHGIDVVAAASGLEDESEVKTLHDLERQGVEGIVGLRRLVDRQMPVVTIEVQMPNICCDTITFNYERGGYEVAQHLRELNHQRIAMVCSAAKYPNTMNFKVLAGVRRAHARIGETYDEHLIHYLPLVFDEQHDQQVPEDLLRFVKKQRPTAIICTVDSTAHYVMNVLGRDGIRVPEDMSITGFSGSRVSRSFESALTTVALPLERAGTEAVRRLLVQATSAKRYPIEMMLDTQLIIGRSTTLCRSGAGRRRG